MWDKLSATTANVVLVRNFDFFHTENSFQKYFNHTLKRKVSQKSFPGADFVLHSKGKYDTMQMVNGKAPYVLVLLSPYETPSCSLVSFTFLILNYVWLSKNSCGLHPKAPLKIWVVRFTLACAVLRLLNLHNWLLPQVSLTATQT